MNDLVASAWPLARLGEAIEALARCAGLAPAAVSAATLAPLRGEPEREDLNSWIDRACARLGIEAESVEATGAELVELLRGAGPALLQYRHAGEHYVLLLLKATARTVTLVAPDLRKRKCPLGIVRAAVCAVVESPISAEVEALLRQANILERKWPTVKHVLVQERIAAQRFGGCWLLRIPPTGSFRAQVSYARLPGRLVAMLAVFAGLYCLEIVGWTSIGRGALGGRLDPGWLVAWALLLLGTVPLRLCGGWLQGVFAIDLGTLLKQRLLSGALKMNMDEVRQQGAGQLLGRVIESQALESLALNGGFAVLIAAIELCLAGWVLALGAGGIVHVTLLLLWIVGTVAVCWRYYQRLRRWTHARLDLTHDLVERMVGHRTRLAQEAPEHRHDAEDQILDQFLSVSSDFDKAFVPLAGGLPRGWLVVGLLGLAPDFVLGSAEATGLAVGLGGVLLAYRALGEVASGLAASARAAVAWEHIAPLFAAAKQAIDSNAPCPVSNRTGSDLALGDASKVLVQARDLVYRYRRQSEPVLGGCDLTIYRGDRLLLEGPSGGGKSTLAALLVGLRQPESGLLLLDGLDRATLGETWRRLSTAAPQFHENHILSGTFAFNLLMGRRWPPGDGDLAEAEQLCDELGLGDLLGRMPSGLMQMVGETGWQLSHGERSRLYLARALLQKSELVVLDESFAALDPKTLDQCLYCAMSRASTLLVIAHP
ncbi:MAG: ATP-binding cassette domain-containing protein [Gammaproteobacteria bacterium]